MNFKAKPAGRKVANLATSLFFLFVTASLLWTQSGSADEGALNILKSAWQQARQADGYQFTTHVVQTTFPAPVIGNVGHSPQEEVVTLRGSNDQVNGLLELELWVDPSTVFSSETAVQVRIENNQTLARVGQGAWQELDGLDDSFAPGGDVALFLAAAEYVTHLGRESRVILNETGPTNISFDRYQFVVNGELLADEVRRQMEETLRRRGELPAGISLQAGSRYKYMAAEGEVWIDEQGLPVRLSLTMEYPQQADGRRVVEKLQTDYSGFSLQSAAAPTPWNNPLGWLSQAGSSGLGQMNWALAGQQLLFLSLVGIAFYALAHLRPTLRYKGCALGLSAQMVLTPIIPLLQDSRLEDLLLQKSAQATVNDAVVEVNDSSTNKVWNSLQSPLTQGRHIF